MQKVLMLLSFMLLSFSSTFISNFENEVNNAYDKYTIIDCKTYESFSIEIIQGINKNKITYGVALYNETAKQNKLHIIVDEQTYTVKKDSRGDYKAVAINQDDEVMIKVINEYEKIEYSCEINLYNSISVFKESDTDFIQGNNKGIKVTSLSTSLNNDIDFGYLYIIFGIIIFGAIIVFVILAICNKGMFNKKRRREEVFNVREYIEAMQKEALQEQQENITVEEVPQEEVKVYDHLHDDDDDITQFDFNNYLQSHGFTSNYEELSKDEKNLIMLELMKLKDDGVMNKNQYIEEVSKLWKE